MSNFEPELLVFRYDRSPSSVLGTSQRWWPRDREIRARRTDQKGRRVSPRFQDPFERPLLKRNLLCKNCENNAG